MKKSKIFMAAGALTLAITAAFATKVNKKFATLSSAYFNSAVGQWYITGEPTGSGAILTTQGTHQLKMEIYFTKSGATPLTDGEGSLITAVKTSGTHLPVFYK